MTTKTAYYARMAEEAARQVTGSREQWTAFLTTAARLYKYPYPEQLMIFTQRPDATACAEYDLWNDRMNRYVKRGSKGIALVDMSGEKPKLRYVFDVTDTGTRCNSRPVYLWKMEDEHVPAIQQTLAESYGVAENLPLEDQIQEIAQKLAAEYWQDHSRQVLDIVADSYLEGYDEFNIGVSFRRAAATSIAYTLLTRTIGDADNYFEHEDFLDIFDFNTQAASNVLGTAVSEMSSQVFREIERSIRTYERVKQAERNQDHDRTDLHAERGLSDPEHRTGTDGEAPAGQVRQDAPGVPAGEQYAAVQSPDPDREAVPAPVGDSGDGDRPDGTADDRAGETEPGTGQENEPAGVGAAHEHAESAGGGTDHDGADHRISDGSGVAHEEDSYGQLSFLFPTEAEQIEKIDTAAIRPQTLAESEKPSAFVIPEEEMNSVLRYGSGFAGGKMRIYALYQQQGDAKERAAFLKKEYGIGGHSYTFEDGSHGFVDYNGKGLFLRSYGHDREKRLTWAEVDKRLDALIQRGDYLTEAEKAQFETLEMEHGGTVPLPTPQHAFPAPTLEPTEPEMAETGTDDFSDIDPKAVRQELESRGIVNGQLADGAEPSPFVRQVMEDVEALSNTEEPSSVLTADSIQTIQLIERQDSPLSHETEYRFSCEINGVPDTLDYTVYRGDDGDSFTIHSKNDDIWDVMPEPELRRLEDILGKAAEFGRWEAHIRGAETAEQLEEVSFSYMETERLNLSPEQRQQVWSLIEARQNELQGAEPAQMRGDEQPEPVEAGNLPVTPEIGDEMVTEELAPAMAGPDTDEFRVGDTIELDGRPFVIEQVGMFDVQMRDPQSPFPVFRSESKERLRRMLGREEPRPVQEQNKSAEPIITAKTQAVYPGDRNGLPYDIVVETLHMEEPELEASEQSETMPETEPDMETGREMYAGEFPDEDEPFDDTTFAEINGELQEFPNEDAAQDALEAARTSAPQIAPQNYHITNDHLGEGGPKAKFRANIMAIQLLKKCEEENRPATPEEQEILAEYVGWGGLADAFDPDKENWATEYLELTTVLTPEEYAAARASTLNAHYTSPTVIKAIYDAVGSIGFEHGNILEPSMGVGNFFGLLPESMSESKLYGVELDSITGRIAQKLYPNADITVAGFETTDRRDFYDIAVGNVPFGNYKVSDKPYDKLGFSIHNYFFAKALDQVRPGGVVAFVTSRYTMDSKNPDARQYLAQRAELLGAIRLPNNAFRANAGTDVVSDILFLQKRDHPIDISPDWVHLGQTPDGLAMNSYFIGHPEMVLGEITSESTQYGKQDLTVIPIEGADLSEQLHEAIQHIGGRYEPLELTEPDDLTMAHDTIPADPNVKNFSFAVVDGEIYFRENSIMRHVELSETATGRVKGMVELRQIVNELMDYQLQDYPEEAIQAKQRELNVAYDRFSASYGLINSRANSQAFAEDSSYYLLCSLENIDENGQLESKADMFTQRTIRPEKVITSVDTPAEALAVSIGERGGVDLPYMAELLGTPEQYDTIITELTGVIFRDPREADPADITKGWRTADDYLSGNVRAKLRTAQLAAKSDPSYAVNVTALEKAQPKDLGASEIDVRLGATWVDPEYIQQFMEETFEPAFYLRRGIEVKFSEMTAEWQITGKSTPSRNDVHAYTTYGTGRANAYKILEDTLNLRDVRIYDTVEDADGKQRRVLNKKETTLAQQKQQAIKDAFRDWVWKDPRRREALVTKYNELFNSTRPREYDGSHIRFGGMNPEIRLREHQQNAIAHVLYGGNTLLAHEVGAGKTFEMAASAMEAKRLGLCQKSLFVVPNHLTLQWANEFLRLYPSAKLLVASKKDFETANRKKFCARIATGDYDAVIIGHSQFEKIPISPERQERLLREQIDEIEDAIAELKYARGEKFSIKQMEKTRKSLQAKLDKLLGSDRKDDVITFEQLGVDRLFVDEAHAFKNLFLYTKMRNVAGLSTSEAQKSSDMFMKCQYMDELTGGRGIVFATGTPVSNSMTELYTMMRYLQHDTLQQKGLTHFDAWASTFGETTTAIELAPEGTGYRARTRFAKFFNLPELMNMFKEVADIKTSDQLHLPVPEAKFETVVVQPSEHQQAMVAELSERAAKVHSGVVDPSVDNMLKITSDGRKLGLDQRLMNPLLPDDPDSKLNACVRNVLHIWEEGKDEKLTQLLFCDLSTPKTDGTFNVYDDIRTKLIMAGVPESEIAFIHDADTEAKKKDLFAKVRTGQVRVLLGSTQKMGAGTNVQDRLVAVHHLDVGWRPADMTQRNGRIIRQGNRNKQVQVYQYVTEGTFDAYLYQTLENKQKFISQIMTSKSPVRSCDDVDEQALSYAEIKALCAGDPHIREKMDLDVDVARLKVLKADHQSQQYRLEDKLLKYFPAEIEKTKRFISGFASDIQQAEAHPQAKDGFCGMEIGGKTFTEKADAGAAILAACKSYQGLEPVKLGSYRGFTIELSFESFSKEFQIALKGDMTHRVSLSESALGNLTRLDNALAGIAGRMEKSQQQLENLYAQVEAAKAEVGKPFPQEEELAAKTARLAELDALLNMDEHGGVSEELGGDDAEPAAGERHSVLADLKSRAAQIPPDRKSDTHEEVL